MTSEHQPRRQRSADVPNQDSDAAEAAALAGRLRAERQYIGLSQADVAEVLGIPRAAVSALETGRRRVTGLELKRLAELYGTSVDQLVGNGPPEDATTAALFRTAMGLTANDKEQVLRFAEFLRSAGRAPTVDHGSANPRTDG
ncbi:helix-turn-helix domain-containing protein [Cellulosimicrobium aquatile]|uniref:helix-turn-helix domain-containing protein n=1 Tax=Cellulosimicrobium aquatile TaxID=1612203 RepID=UPI0014595476|nr:helix-turn-helix transcriptional regulator [Cellulosimicrobium aquatile]NMF28839.1 helix-turn-helix transcriptional regulator [Cellulosimicrobium aquatile]